MGNNFPIQAAHFEHQRKNHGYTQIKLCEILDRDLQTYRKWEKGNKRPDSEVLVKLSELYNVSTDYLLGLTEEKRHGINYIKEETGLSEDAITALQYVYKMSMTDFYMKPNRRIISIINMVLDKDGKEIAKLKQGEAYITRDLFTLLYDYVFSNSRGTSISPETISFSYDLSLDRVDYETLPLLREALISGIRKELDSFMVTKKQGKKPC